MSGEEAKKRIELARLIVEAALLKCERLGVTVHSMNQYAKNKNSFGAQINPDGLKYHHPDAS